jgi:hypothetical protein
VKKRNTGILGLLTLGIVIGFGLGILVMGYRIDFLINRNSLMGRDIQQLKNKINQLEEDIEKKDRDIRSKTSPKISTITIYVEGIESTSIALKIEEKINYLLKDIIGKPLDGLDPIILEKTLEGRILDIDDRMYAITPIRSLYNKETHIWIRAQRR